MPPRKQTPTPVASPGAAQPDAAPARPEPGPAVAQADESDATGAGASATGPAPTSGRLTHTDKAALRRKLRAKFH
jgi:hypothetical protein